MSNRVTLETAWDLLRDASFFDAVEDVAAEDAHGRVCAAGVRARTDLPPFHTALFDGYALASASLTVRDRPAPLKITQTVCAGSIPGHAVENGTAAAVMTGAPMPDGADCVVPLESARRKEDLVWISGQPVPGQYAAARGSRVRRGDIIIERGEEITSWGLQQLLSAGVSKVSVYRRPGVTVYSTGDELVRPPGPAGSGQVFSSSDTSLTARLSELGVPAVRGGIVADNPVSLEKAVRAGLAASQIVITIGGTGRGDKDLMPRIIQSVCGGLLFTGLDIRPGGGAAAGTVDGKLVIALPGSPGSAAVGFELLVRPAAAEMSRLPRVGLRRASALAADRYSRKKGGRKFLWGTLFLENAECRVIPGDAADLPSGEDITVLSRCLIDIPEETGKFCRGDVVNVFLC